jgi:hypothetical protein
MFPVIFKDIRQATGLSVPPQTQNRKATILRMSSGKLSSNPLGPDSKQLVVVAGACNHLYRTQIRIPFSRRRTT